MQTGSANAGVSPTARRLRIPAFSSSFWLAVIIATAFLLRLAWILVSEWQPLPDDDAFRYDFAARALADGRGYIHLNGEPTAFWPPAYPLLLALLYTLFGQHVVVAQLLNVALSTATVVLVFLIGRRTLDERAAFAGAAIVAGFPSLIFFTGVTLSEVAFTFFALLGIYLVVLETQSRRDDAFLLITAGLVLGMATLTRGQALMLPVVVIPFWLASGIGRSGVLRRIAVLALGIALVVVPWTVRNAIELSEPVLISTNAGVDFWIGHHEGASGDFGATGGDELVFRYPELDSTEREVRVNRDGFREGLEFAATHPVEELALPLQKLFWLYYNDEEGLRWNDGHGAAVFLNNTVREGLLALSNVYYFAALSFAALGVRLWLTLRDPGRALLVSLVAYWTLVHLAFFANPRFHAPVMPLAALLAAPAILSLWAGRAPWVAVDRQ